MQIDLEDQIKELKREIAMRKKFYPSFVRRAKITQETADRQMARMHAALQTLLALNAQNNRQGELFANDSQAEGGAFE